MFRRKLWLAGAGALAVTAAALPGVAFAGADKPSPHPAPPATVVNADFEDDGTGVAAPSGWSESGQVDASYTEAGGATGSYRLTHWSASASAYTVETFQRVTGLGKGPYTLRASVRTSGDQNAAYLFLRDCGGPQRTVAVPRTGPEWWVQIVVSTDVRGGACTLGVHSDGVAGSWLNVDSVSLTPGAAGDVAISGADVSQLQKNEDHGAVYRDASGKPRDALRILGDNGVNYIRLKVWVNPADGYSDKAHLLTMARRVKARGMKLLVDFHYSDSWADPGKQNKPAAWADLPFDQLRQKLYDYTYDVLTSLDKQHTPADMAQIGNEINGGILWPDGKDWDSWDGTGALLSAASNAVRAASPRTKVVVHLAEGGNNGGAVWWLDNAISHGVQFDVIAVSQYLYWHGPLGYLQANLLDLVKRYNKDVMVAETAYGFTTDEQDAEPNIFTASLAATAGYPATPAGQAQALRDMFNTVAAIPGGRGLGVFYWEPTWTAVPGGGWDPADPNSGDGWENQALFDYSGRALPALRVFGEY